MTSLPRSPISPITMTSTATWRASIASRLDLPTPEPAKMPSRWPRQSGRSVSRRLDAGLDARTHPPAGEGRRRPALQRISRLAAEQRTADRLVQGTTEGVHDPAEPAGARSRVGLPDQAHQRARRDAMRLAVQQEQGRPGVEADDLAGQIRTARAARWRSSCRPAPDLPAPRPRSRGRGQPEPARGSRPASAPRSRCAPPASRDIPIPRRFR